MRRRDLIGASAFALAGLPLLARERKPAKPAASASAPATRTFDYAWLKGHARNLSLRPYQPAPEHFPPALAKVDWDHWQAIRFRPERALWARAKLPFRIEFFHLGLQFRRPVRMYEVVDGDAREIAYDASRFDLSKSGLAAGALPSDLGYAGFRIHFHTDFTRDVAAFLGASYFRAVSGTLQYGLSARGLAVDCGMDKAEEFPDFTAFWFERPRADAALLTVHALLDSPSVAGAYRFDIAPGPTQVMRVAVALYPRRPIERLGVAPLTSMFLVAPYDRRVPDDWRPSIHDSDGLALHTGKGEWLLRPLVNPSAKQFNEFADSAPRGFGLLQRDRDFDHYQDDGVFYDKRPSAWVEPIDGFGDGAVDLLELPANDETADNIAAFWKPAQAPAPGQELLYGYNLYWCDRIPDPPPLARAIMAWSGIGGLVGATRDYFSWRFVIDFAGETLARLPPHAPVEAVVHASAGTTELVSARPLAALHGYRAMFDARPGNAREVVTLRLFLRLHGKPLSETWLYQWRPPPHVAP